MRAAGPRAGSDLGRMALGLRLDSACFLSQVSDGVFVLSVYLLSPKRNIMLSFISDFKTQLTIVGRARL